MRDEHERGGQGRRAFLKRVAAAGGAWVVAGCRGLPAAQGLAASPAWGERIGVQLYTVRDRMEKDFVGTLEQVARIGYREVEFAGYFEHSPREVRQLLDRLGLRAPSAHVGLELLRSDLAGQLEAARVVGNEYVTVPALTEAFAGRPLDLAFWRRTAEEFNRIAGAARAQGLRFAYHNHWFEFDRLEDGRTGFDVLLGETDPALVDFELDLFWATLVGQDPVAMFQRSPGRYPLWHVKDMRDAAEGKRLAAAAKSPGEYMQVAGPRLAAVGTGEIDFRRIFAHAGEAGLRHFFVENDAAAESGSSLANIETSFQNLERVLS